MEHAVCLDYFDDGRVQPTNQPESYALHPAADLNRPGMFSTDGPIVSWDRAMMAGHGVNVNSLHIPEGTERFSAPEGSYITLRREGSPDFTFQIPTQNAFTYSVCLHFKFMAHFHIAAVGSSG